MTQPIEVERLSAAYSVRALSEADIPDILALYRGNPDYFKHCPPAPSENSIRLDLSALPAGKERGDKYFVGFYQSGILVAVMDLIAGYPEEEMAFIGLFMVDGRFRHRGTGTAIVTDCLRALSAAGYGYAQLGCVESNRNGLAFWRRNGFSAVDAVRQARYTVVRMKRALPR